MKRFWDKVHKTETCWEWSGQRTAQGYGRIKIGLQPVVAHRWMWEQEYGPIPDGTLVCHHCDNPPCVRPEHLFLGTHADNAHDRNYKGRDWQSRITHCPQGHPYDESNTYLYPLGNRGCVECNRVKCLRRYYARRAIKW